MLAMILTGVTTHASQSVAEVVGPEHGLMKRYRNAQPIKFVERGVKFFIYPNGEFEYLVNDPVYTRRGTVSVGISTQRGDVFYNHRGRAGASVLYDRFGRIARIGTVPVFYDSWGRVVRTGSVYMDYNRRGWLSQVGGLSVKYNPNGKLIRTFGTVHQQFRPRAHGRYATTRF